MCFGNNGWGGNSCLWIIILIILFCGCGNNGCGCGCGNNNWGCGNNNWNSGCGSNNWNNGCDNNSCGC